MNKLSAISWWEQDTFNEMIKAAELDHLTELDIYYANSLKQQLTSNQSLLVLLNRLWCLTPHSIIFQLYRSSQFYQWRKPEYTTNPPHVTDKLYHIYFFCSCIEHTSPWAGFELTTLVVIGNCTGSCKSNYHVITSTTARLTPSFILLHAVKKHQIPT